jgi:chromosome segregation protein
MRLEYIELCGFRGYQKPFRIDFADCFTIIDGRNGSGKSTIFDAVEFALTGTISKYGDAKASGETIADYIWWNGDGPVPSDRYVEVGFRNGNDILSLRRAQFVSINPQIMKNIQNHLFDAVTAPKSPLPQLCRTSIIRDEHIAAFSLDLKEADRYSLLCDAIGATDAETWVERGAALLNAAKKRVQIAQGEVDLAARGVTAAARRSDEIRAMLVEGELVSAAVARLQLFTGSTETSIQLIEPARGAISEAARKLEELASLEAEWQEAEKARLQLNDRRKAVFEAREAKDQADRKYTDLTTRIEPPANSGLLAQQARDLSTLAALGHKLGLLNGHCPLCASDRTISEFEAGLVLAESYAKQLDAQAVEQAKFEQAKKAASAEVEMAQVNLDRCERAALVCQNVLNSFESRLAATGLPKEVSLAELRERQLTMRRSLNAARDDLRIITTLQLNAELEKASHQEVEAKEIYARAQEKLGLARRAESRAQALHNAARRATGETLDKRLDRVLPLMVELYRRLRPHPLWGDIEYKIRGDVKRFLSLQVGDELNPQFMFSSGQRRATGLAFLLSVNLSLAWSRWQTILLDDPVQHIDDFRSIHLAEVMAQLSASGRQIICAVEDAALADLLCRRLPVEDVKTGKRVTLGPDADGAIVKLKEQNLVPLVRRALVTEAQRLAG